MENWLRSVEVEAPTVEEAIDRALKQLGKSREEVDVEVLSEPKRPALGLFGGQPARVRVRERVVSKEEGFRKIVQYIFDLLKIPVPFELDTSDGDFRILIEPGQDAGMVIGKYGQTADALEHLLWKIAKSQFDHRGRVFIEVGGYRDRQQEKLRRHIQQSIRYVLDTGRWVALEPLTVDQVRMAVGMILKHPGLHYTIIGQGLYRTVVITSSKVNKADNVEEAEGRL